MVNNPSQLDLLFSAFADPIRRSILSRLKRGDATVSELAAPHKVSLPAISKHVQVLERAGLVQRKRAGRLHQVRLVARPMKEATDWLDAFRQVAKPKKK
jgi:DNA-binding transcriptional ArsR family regulator